jgi:protein required for attachment to host cells
LQRCPPESEAALSFIAPDNELGGLDRAEIHASVERGDGFGEPWLTRFDPGALIAHVRRFGFRGVFHLGLERAQQLYFAGRRDGLAALRREQLVAVTFSKRNLTRPPAFSSKNLIERKVRDRRSVQGCPIRRCLMDNVKICQGDWVVVCDGKKALVLENAGDEKFLNLKTKRVYEHADPKTHEQGTDAPGRTVSSIEGRRSAMEQTDWHDQEEQRFLHKLLGHLESAVNAGHAKSLIMVAPPRALGVLRPAYSHAVRNALRAEIDKDLVKMPIDEIEKRLAA